MFQAGVLRHARTMHLNVAKAFAMQSDPHADLVAEVYRHPPNAPSRPHYPTDRDHWFEILDFGRQVKLNSVQQSESYCDLMPAQRRRGLVLL